MLSGWLSAILISPLFAAIPCTDAQPNSTELMSFAVSFGVLTKAFVGDALFEHIRQALGIGGCKVTPPFTSLFLGPALLAMHPPNA